MKSNEALLALLGVTKEAGVELCTGNTTVTYRQQSAAHYQNKKLANKSSENVAKDKRFAKTPTNHNCM
jgi:hypothetical protein